MKTLRAIMKDRTLMLKCLGVLGILAACRLLSNIPAPGVNSEYFASLLEENATLNFLNIMTGGGLSSLSIATLSITPYITGSIIIQLLGVVFPSLHELQRSPDKTDQRKVKIITFATGAGLAVVEAAAMAVGFGRQGMLNSYTWTNVALTAGVWALGAIALAGAGELISDKLVGNGISLILAMNILASFPSDMSTVYTVLIKGNRMIMQVAYGIAVAAFLCLLFAFCVLLNETCKKIPITYSGKLKGSPSYAGARTSELPIKLCPGSVIPIIFASSLLSFPVLIASFAGASENAVLKTLNSSYWFNASNPVYTIGAVIYIALIFGFSYFYADIAMNSAEVADNLRKSGGIIPGIRPGKPTDEYLSRTIHTVCLIGAAALSVIAIIPYIVSGLTGMSSLSMLGTSLIIVVSVVLETKDTLHSKVLGSLYMDNVRKGGIFHV